MIYFCPDSDRSQCWVIDPMRQTLTLLRHGHFVGCVTLKEAIGYMAEAKKVTP